jgi:hypothetical protein
MCGLQNSLHLSAIFSHHLFTTFCGEARPSQKMCPTFQRSLFPTICSLQSAAKRILLKKCVPLSSTVCFTTLQYVHQDLKILAILMCRVGQNHIRTPYMAVCSKISANNTVCTPSIMTSFLSRTLDLFFFFLSL